MKLAIVADVHGNLAALDAVLADLDAQAPDEVVVGGDLVLNGPRPAECLQVLRERGWPSIVGNTDQALWERGLHGLPPGMSDLADWTVERVGESGLSWLQSLPMEWRDDDRVALVHAVPGDLWTVVAADAPEEELRRVYEPLGARLAVYCHIHVAFVRPLGDDFTVANSGSVGMPFDGDARASYLLVDDGRPATRRVPYDLDRAVHDLHHARFPAAQRLEQIYRQARPA